MRTAVSITVRVGTQEQNYPDILSFIFLIEINEIVI